jgi:hypothetical protein
MTAINTIKSEAESAVSQLRQELDALTTAKSEAETELNTAKLKNGKLLVKVKTLSKQVRITSNLNFDCKSKKILQ